MAVEDILESLAETSQFLDECGMKVWASLLRDQESEIAEANRDGKPRRVKRRVKKLKQYFGGMGSLNDLVISKDNRNLHPQLSEEEADRRLGNLLDQLFMWCLFWNYDRETALRTYQQLLQRYPHELPPRVRHAFGR